MGDRIQDIEAELRAIKERNARVETDKAWERSWIRISVLLLITFVIASIVFYEIGNDHPLRNALIPTIAYFLSIQSLPFLKKWWSDSRIPKREF